MADNNEINAESETPAESKPVVDINSAEDSKKVFVGGLHWEATDADLREHFSQFGNVLVATIKLDRITGKSRGFGFVLYETEAEVQKAMSAPEHVILGKKIDPKPAKPPLESKKKIFVGGLDPDATEEQIREYFQQYGKIENLELPTDKATSKRKAYIFVTFSTEEEAKTASKTPKQDICDRQCDVRIAVPQDQVNRQRNQNQYGGYGYNPNYYGGYDGYGYSQGYGYGYGGQGYDPNAAYGGYSQPGYDYYGYGGYGDQSYGYPAYQPYPRGGGKMRGGRGGAGNGSGYHPYSKQ